MATPLVNGTYSSHNAGPATPEHVINISVVPVGGWMLVSVMSAVSTTLTPPEGWTTLADRIQSGTRQNFLYAKIRTLSDGSTATFTVGAVGNISYALLWGTGADAVDHWTVGTQWLRNTSLQPTGARYANIAPGVTTTHAESLVIALSHEATLAMVQSDEVTDVSPTGWTRRLWLAQHALNDRIETVWMATKDMPVPGATGDVTVTYSSPQDANGWALQLVIPPDTTPVPVTQTGIVGTPSQFAGATNTDFALSRPAGAQNGDYVVVAVRGQSSTMTAQPASDGFTRLGPAFVASTNSYRVNGFYGRPILDVETEPESYIFTITASTSNTRLLATAFLVRGVNLEAPLAGFHNSYSGTSIANGVMVEEYALADTPVLSLFAAGSEFTATNDHAPVTTPTGYSTVSTLSSADTLVGSRSFLWVGSKESLASPVEDAAITWGSPVAPAAEGISLRTIDTPTPDPRGSGYTAFDGQGKEVRVFYATPDSVRTPRQVFAMRRGFNSVAEMLATPGFTWAHRGGSASYPEHSLYAYTQAVARGYGVLEVSLGRTSDGVWFGLHDQTTDRTSGGTYGNASSQTWAQIQQQTIVVGAEGAPQPYMRWSELVAAYGATHLFVIDPKYAVGLYRTEFLNMVYTDVGPTRAIIKYSGGGSGAAALSAAAQAMGFQTWGFFYANDASLALGGTGALQTWGPSWSMIGMEYTAPQAVWNEALDLGRPVIGHIAPNQAAYAMAIAKGAYGVQVSGVGVVEPVSWWSPPPLAAWSFSEGSGGIAADSQGTRALTVTSENWAVGYKHGGLSAAGGPVIIPDKAGVETQHRTLLFWARWAGNGTNWRWGVDFHITELDTSCWGIMPISGTNELYCRIRIGATNTNIILNNSTTEGEWHHYAITYNGAQFIAYRDGVVMDTQAVTGNIDPCDEIIIHPDGGTNTIDSLRMFNRALTQAQIIQQMNS